MYRSFSAKNFRGIREVELTDLGRVNILTGLNDAGKTSILEAIFLHASGPLAGALTIQTVRPGRGQNELNLSPQAESPWRSLFFGFDESAVIELAGTTRTGPYVLTIEDSPSRSPSQVISTGPAATSNRVGITRSVKITERRGKGQAKSYRQQMTASSTPGDGGATVQVTFKVEPEVAEPFALATLIKSPLIIDLADGFSKIRRSSKSLDLLSTLKEIDDRIDSLEVLVDGDRAQLYALLGENLIPFSLLGDGPVAMAQYLIAIAQTPGGVLLIDEVGSGVHYSLLPQMWRTLYRAAERLDVQLFVTTHSQESLIAAQKVVSNRANDLNIYRIRRAVPGEPSEASHFWGDKLEAAIHYNTELR